MTSWLYVLDIMPLPRSILFSFSFYSANSRADAGHGFHLIAIQAAQAELMQLFLQTINVLGLGHDINCKIFPIHQRQQANPDIYFQFPIIENLYGTCSILSIGFRVRRVPSLMVVTYAAMPKRFLAMITVAYEFRVRFEPLTAVLTMISFDLLLFCCILLCRLHNASRLVALPTGPKIPLIINVH